MTKVHLTKNQANYEIETRKSLLKANPKSVRTLDSKITILDVKKYIDEDVNSCIFKHTGACPYVFDFLAQICTDKETRGYIDRVGNDNETHYRISNIPIEDFIRLTLGKEGKCQASNLQKELKKLALHNPNSYVRNRKDNTVICTQVISITIARQAKAITSRLLALKNINANSLTEDIIIINIDFYKPLWAALVEGGEGGWFDIPNRFHVKMKNTINHIKNAIKKPYNPSLNIHRRFWTLKIYSTSIGYRKLFFYLNLHDNGKGAELNIDAINMALYCDPSLLQTKIKEGKEVLEPRRWRSIQEFVIKGLLLIHYMGINTCMEGARLVPESVYYNPFLIVAFLLPNSCLFVTQ